MLREFAREYGEIGSRMGVVGMQAEAACLERKIPEGLPDLTAKNQARMRRVIDRLSFLKRGLPQRATVQGSASGAREETWPQADCTIAAEDQTSYAQLIAEIAATTAAELALMKKEEACYGPKVEPVVSTPLSVGGACAGGGFEDGFGEGTIEVTTPAEIEWAGATNTPELCIPFILALQQAEYLMAQTDAYLECWEGAWVDANYERLEVLRDEIKDLQEQIEFLTAFEVETQLHIWSGTRIAYLYLPEELGGIAEETATITTNALENTKDAGYIVHPKVENRMSQATSKSESGELKRAFDLYMKVYRDSTAKSQRRLP